jgi:hypothetical protein
MTTVEASGRWGLLVADDVQVDVPRVYRLPVWALPVVGLLLCIAAGWFLGSAAAGVTLAVLAVVAVSTVGADVMPNPRGRHLAQLIALVVAALILALSFLRAGVVMPEPFAVVSDGSPVDLRNRTVAESDLRDRSLRSAQLQGATLSGIDLNGFDLTGADLSGAFLVGTDLAGARLDRANLRGADLRQACLRGSTLQGADLTNVDAVGADATGAVVDPAATAAARVWPGASAGQPGAACTR